jgi:ParB family chromosome partitioning protein
MTTERYLTYRGDVKAAGGVGGTLLFVTVHPEGQPTAFYRLDADKLTLEEAPLPCGGTALAAEDEVAWVAGTDGRVYRCPLPGGKPKPLGAALAAAPVALALLSGDRLAVLVGVEISLIARKDGSILQTLELPEPGTCLAADQTGNWLVAGTSKGTVAVFEGEGKDEFQPAESGRLHEGAVSALLFEREELRFFSAGADQKLLSTHARGRLEPEDKGRGNNHTDLVTALIWGPGDRFFSGSRDGTVKTWPRVGAVRPATLKEGVGRPVALAFVQIHKRQHLVTACDDNTLRFFLVDEAGKFGDLTHKFYDAYARAKHEFDDNDARRREAILKELAGYKDAAALDLVAARVNDDADHGLRLLAAQLLGESANPRAIKPLEDALMHRDEAVRLAALAGLRKHQGESDLRPLNLALRAAKPDVGRAAVAALEELAPRDDQALALLTKALNAKTPEVRQAALTSIEKVHDPQSPEGDLIGLESKHADLRRLALLRLFQRKMLGHPKVQAALRWRAEDEDLEVRRTAFLLSLHTRERLVRALRERDPDLHRQLTELESGELPSVKEEKPKKGERAGPAAAGVEVVRGQLEKVAQASGVPLEALEEQMKQLGVNPGDRSSVLSNLLAQMLGLVKKLRKPGEEEQ